MKKIALLFFNIWENSPIQINNVFKILVSKAGGNLVTVIKFRY